MRVITVRFGRETFIATENFASSRNDLEGLKKGHRGHGITKEYPTETPPNQPPPPL